MSSAVLEINATAGVVGTTSTVTLNGSAPNLRLNGGPGRTLNITVLGGGPLRHATIDNAGTFGTWTDQAAGSSFTCTSSENRQVVLLTDNSTPLRVVSA